MAGLFNLLSQPTKLLEKMHFDLPSVFRLSAGGSCYQSFLCAKQYTGGMIEYNDERTHDLLGDLTPMEARMQFARNSTF